MVDSLDDAIKEFRVYAWSVKPEFGAEVDKLILQGSGFGEVPPGDLWSPPGSPPSATGSKVLDKLINGLSSAATAAQLSLKQYYDAATTVRMMQQAHNAGVLVDTYAPGAQVTRTMSNLFSDPNSPTPSVLGVPIWMLLAGGAAVLIFSRR